MRGGNNRIVVYFAGFLIGMMLVSLIMSRRAAREQAKGDPWISHNAEMVEAGAAPLPESVHPSITKGLMIDYGLLPGEEAPEQRVWLLKFEGSYPNVRVVQSMADSTITYMAADQIKVALADGVDVTELKPMLDALGLRLRMFNRKEKLAVLGVLHTGISAVPDTLEAIQPWSELFDQAEPDWILFKGE
ncbi:MAG: hypothetical protein ACPGSB_09465 [Opitutales bacterium]